MNLFGGFGNFGRGDNNCICNLVWLLFLLSICGCDTQMFGGNDCGSLILILLLLSCCGCGTTPCGNN